VCVQNSSNLGAPSTINLGISLARGEWIALLNSDDVFHEMRLSHLLEFADDEKAEFVFSKVSFIYDDSTILRSDRLTIKKISEAQANAWRFKSIKEALFNFNFCATSGNMLFKNEVMAALGGFKPLQYCHDWEFILRAVDQFSVSFLPEILYGYRLHGENSFKSLAGIAHHESEVVARGVRERSLKSMTRSLVWEFGSLGILATWNGHH
jgi:glycosyltransferase involved in cell wall biosynthesis